MKEYLTQEQTAELVELGFTKPKTKLPFEVANDELGYTYSIGELLSTLNTYELEIDNIDIFHTWTVSVHRIRRDGSTRCEGVANELIDALFEVCVKLKKEEYE